MNNDESRRRFLKDAGVYTAILMTSGLHGWGRSSHKAMLPLHPGLLLPGVHGYPGMESVEAGKTIKFFVSAAVPYTLNICRLGISADDPNGDEILHTSNNQKAFQQPIYPGSYVFVEKGFEGNYSRFSAEGWVRPWKVDQRQCVFSQEQFSVLLNPEGGLDILMSNKQYSTPAAIFKKDVWHHWSVVRNGSMLIFYLDGVQQKSWSVTTSLSFTGKPLTIGARINRNNQLENLSDIDIAAIACYNISLNDDQVKSRFECRGLTPPGNTGLIANWMFNEEKGDKVADRSVHNRRGKIINHATWMIGGPSFLKEVKRFTPYSPTADDHRGHGLRLASDDLYDCAWKETASYKVPAEARSGLYVARIKYNAAGKDLVYDISFIVRKPASAKKATILVMASTNTWRAYNATPFALQPSTLKYSLSTEGLKDNPRNPPAFSFYRTHAAGQGTYQVGLKIPWPAAGPYVLYGSDYSHLLRADRFTHIWLEKEGYDYDLITDTDLHKNPEILKSYKVFIVNGHSEYWSIVMYDGLEAYLKAGGQTIILSGNTMFWRVSFNNDCSVMECRKVDAPGEQVPAPQRGEAWHSHDGLKGGLLRETPNPGWKLSGLEMLGWINSGIDEQYGPYEVENPDHFLFNVPNKTGLAKGDAFGLSPGGKLPGVNGHEIDVRLSTLKKLQEKPNLTSFPQEPKGIITLATGRIPWKLPGREHVYSGESFDLYMRKLEKEHQQGADMIYWEREDGGKVFNAGAIRSGWALGADEKF
ncbi:MAG TPA: LamG domain-containing protein, partial [Chitinophagaceae bacterium]|nr:LamG domain-containing protein [Chitinophagaceae bacterium]